MFLYIWITYWGNFQNCIAKLYGKASMEDGWARSVVELIQSRSKSSAVFQSISEARLSNIRIWRPTDEPLSSVKSQQSVPACSVENLLTTIGKHQYLYATALFVHSAKTCICHYERSCCAAGVVSGLRYFVDALSILNFEMKLFHLSRRPKKWSK